MQGLWGLTGQLNTAQMLQKNVRNELVGLMQNGNGNSTFTGSGTTTERRWVVAAVPLRYNAHK
jgi:hypothetical protein